MKSDRELRELFTFLFVHVSSVLVMMTTRNYRRCILQQPNVSMSVSLRVVFRVETERIQGN